MKKITMGRALSFGALMAVVGCAGAEVGEAPSADTDTMESQQVIYNTNAQGIWSSEAWTPSQNVNFGISGGGTFGVTDQVVKQPTRRMGVCLLKQGSPGAGTTCNTVADCTAAPTNLPAGGFRYCVAPDGVGAKKCYVRPGPASSYCVGTPALAGSPPIAPGSYTTPTTYTAVVGKWISYGCFEGCSATDPSSSSLAHIVPEGNCGGQAC
jgi:hypothetical protein